MSRVAGVGRVGRSSSTARAAISGITMSHSRPPRRPVLGLRGACSHSASFTTDQRSVRCSRYTITHDEDELPDQAGQQGQDQRTGQRCRPVQDGGESWRDQPRQGGHGQRGGRPSSEDAGKTVLGYGRGFDGGSRLVLCGGHGAVLSVGSDGTEGCERHR